MNGVADSSTCFPYDSRAAGEELGAKRGSPVQDRFYKNTRKWDDCQGHAGHAQSKHYLVLVSARQ